MKRVHRLMRDAVAGGVFPGGVLLVSREGRIRFVGSYGVTCLQTARPVTRDTVFDLASLTKPLATTLAVMWLVESGRLDLDRSLGRVLPPFAGTDKAGITVRQLLSHRSGIPAYRPYFVPLWEVPHRRRKGALVDWVIREPLSGRPGQSRLYSDIGFMILQWVLERISGQSLDRFVARSIYAPQGLTGLFFPGVDPVAPLPFAATERCGLRRRMLVGEVHDENAFVMGGVGGHAGLFGTVDAVWKILVGLTNIVKGRTKRGWVRRETVMTFFRDPVCGAPLGFDTPSPKGASAGRFFSPRSVGHLGFTGTSFWADLDRDVIVILLTNRVHPTRNNVKIKAFRPVLHDEIIKTLAQET